ncbi:nicotinamide phosphoribosyltransferase domain-containing protein [Vibrio owensii]|uniref:nicotinamide phosphoribosyltransferase domain-containing protein n=1 Tax=Vibrio owensii TaxID=696485 RepID=UPI0033907CD5
MSIIEAIDNKKLVYIDTAPDNLEWTQAYGEARAWGKRDELIPAFGVRRFVAEFLTQPISQQDIDAAAVLAGPSFKAEVWQRILDQHQGLLPLKIVCKPDGALAKAGEPIYTIESTDPELSMLPSIVDKLIVANVWHDSTLALKVAKARSLINGFANKTSSNSYLASFKAGSGGDMASAHLTAVSRGLLHIGFPGTLCIKGAKHLNNLYHTNLVANSEPVQDHASVLAHGGSDDDLIGKTLDVYSNQFCHFMLDTNDFRYVLDELIGKKYRDVIAKRGHALSVAVDSTEIERDFFYVRDRLADIFGVTVNEMGYKKFDAPVILSQSEDLTLDELRRVVQRLEREGWAIDSFYFVISDDYFQTDLRRGNLGFIQKVCAIKRDGIIEAVCKNPINDPGKKTLAGIQTVQDGIVIYENGKILSEEYESVVDRFQNAVTELPNEFDSRC